MKHLLSLSRTYLQTDSVCTCEQPFSFRLRDIHVSHSLQAQSAFAIYSGKAEMSSANTLSCQPSTKHLLCACTVSHRVQRWRPRVPGLGIPGQNQVRDRTIYTFVSLNGSSLLEPGAKGAYNGSSGIHDTFFFYHCLLC